jgi:uncharacterized repeat protein (TIGR03803 family)
MTGLSRRKSTRGRSARVTRLQCAVVETLEPRRLLSTSYALTTLASFNGTDGAEPVAGLVADGLGNLYGTTQTGGTGDSGAGGTVFELKTGSHVPTTLVDFNFTDGAEPQGSLILDGAGTLYGTTDVGGLGDDGIGDHDGTVFEITAGSNTPTTLYNFNGTTDAGNPAGSLYMDSSGNLYGTVPLSLFSNGGIVYELPAGPRTYTPLDTFPTNHGGPTAGLIADSQGNLYGSALVGGPTQNGSIFELTAGSHTFSTVATFNGTDGSGPVGNLAVDSKGDLFGVTGEGGTDNDGTIFEIVAGSNTVTTLGTFNNINGADPLNGVYLDASGNLFGTTEVGGDQNTTSSYGVVGAGTIWEVPAGTHTITTLYAFTGFADGGYSESSLIADGAGDFFGTTSTGGTAGGDGTIFELSPVIPAKVAYTQPPGAVSTGTQISPAITVAVEGANGDLADADTSTVTLSVASGPAGGTIGGTTSVAAVDGVARFSTITLSAPGNYTLTASDGALTSVTSSSFAVTQSAGPAAKLVFIQQPESALAGAAITPNITVDVEDITGNVVTSDSSSTVVLSIASGPPAGTASAGVVDGVATFSGLVLDSVGTYTLKATDGALTAGISNPFLISDAAGPAAKLQFIQEPTDCVPGGSITPAVTVDVEDASGNLVTGDNSSTVILSIASGPPAGTASAGVVSGVATFTGLYLNPDGTYTIKATDGALASATSTSFVIAPPFATLTSGALLVEGTAGNDTIALTTSGSTLTATMNGVAIPFTLASITSIDVEGNAGADFITLGAGVPSASVQGGPGADTITCSDPGADTLGGGKGHDSITCGAGADFVRGGAGADTLVGGSGGDTLEGGLGSDILRSGSGEDQLNGGAGFNQMYGGAEATQFYAENGTDDQVFAGSAANDVLFYTASDSPVIESGSIAAGNQTLVA